MRKPILAAAAAISMLSLSSGAVAQSAAQSAAPLSLAGHLAPAAASQDSNEIRGGFILPTLALIIIGVLIYVVAKGDSPNSP